MVKIPENFIKHKPTSPEHADKEIENSKENEIELENGLRTRMKFEEGAFKENEPVASTTASMVKDKTVSQPVIHDSDDGEINISGHAMEI